MKDYQIATIVLCFVIFFIVAVYKEIYRDYKTVLRQEEKRITREIEIQEEILDWRNK